METGKPESARANAPPGPRPVRRDVLLFAVFALLGAAAARIHTKIPNTEIYFELRWVFAFMGMALIRRTGLAALLVALLAVAYPGETPLATVFFGNMAYMVPAFVAVRLLYARRLRAVENPVLFGVAWCALVLLCYQIFFTPILWGVVALMEQKSFASGMLEGWRTQPLLVESVLVGLISAAGLSAFRAYGALRAEEKRFRSFVENANDIVYALSSEGRFTYVSPNWPEFMGEPAEAAIGKSFEPYVHPEDVQACRDFFEDVLVSGKKQASVEYRVRRPDGTWRRHVSSGSPLRDADGRVTGYLGIARDVTDAKRADEALKEREARYRILIEQTGDCMLIHDLDGNLVDVNEFACATYGYTREELLGMKVHDLDPDYTEREAGGRFWDNLKLYKPVVFEARQRTKAGREFSVEVRLSLIKHRGETVVLGFCRDITDRKRAEEALRASERELRAALRMARLGSWVFDIVNDDVIFSPALQEILGLDLPGGRLDRESAIELTLPEDRDAWRAGIRNAVETGEPFRCVSRVAHADGSVVWFQTETEKVDRNTDGAPVRLFGISQDITERKQMQDRMRQMEKMDAIGQLAGGVAHDFNNQLAGIMGYGDMLLGMLDEPKLKTYVEHMLTATNRAADLTRQLLAFARKSEQHYAPTDLHAIVHEVVAVLERSIDKRIIIRQRLEAAERTVHGDATQLQNAILNLGVNARDAMPEGGDLYFETGNATLSETDCARLPYQFAPGRYVELRVRDTGCGMTEKVRKRIFEPFFTTKDVGKGTGMGLAAVYGTVKHHGGAIHVYSEPGEGTCFRLLLPLTGERAETQAAAAPDPAGLKGLRVLLIDDEEILRDMASDMLYHLGCEVHAEADGRAGLAYYRDHWRDIDVVILDMVMPRMAGREAFRAIREIHPGARMLIASGFSAGGEGKALLEEGAAGFIQKPFQQDTLVKALLKVVG